MKTRILFTTLIILTTLFSVWSQDLVKKNGTYESQYQKVFAVNAGGNLVIQDLQADVKVTTWSENKVQIHEFLRFKVFTQEEAEARIKRWKDRFELKGNTVYIHGNEDLNCKDCKIEIKVPEKFNLDFRIANGDIEISDLQGNIKVRTSGGDIDMANITGTITSQTSGGDLDFVKISGEISANTSGGDISLSDIFAKAELSTSGGDINIENATQKVSLSTSGGDINVRNVSSEINMSTSGGDITVMDFTGPRISFSTSGGDIEMVNIAGELKATTSGGDIEGTRLLAKTSVVTSGGDIELSDVHGPIAAATTGGDVEVDVRLNDFSKPHDISLQTTGGDITLYIPSKLPASIDAELRLNSSDRQWQRYDIYSDFPLTKSMPDDNDRRIISKGDINGGGDPIVLRANGGSIYIKKN